MTHCCMCILLTATGILVAAPKFSKYIHGAASLFPDVVPAYPHWFVADDTTGAMRAITVDELADAGVQPLATVRD
jgi:SPX domain protein involved in polyphosphate accumulation